ncbi:MAG: L,D-transpeptidase family protein [Desulfobacula sp.]|jgi:murein L,D-transpeptidase YafK
MEKKNNNKKYLLVLLILFVASILANPAISAEDNTRPSAIIRLPENENAILVEKKNQTLFLYSSRAGNLQLQYKTPCSTGEMNGVKQKAGDKKTPEGIYFLKDEYEDQYLSAVYGVKAFPLDYPNLIDKRTGKDGSAIWIHGTNKVLKPMDSNGCIALENSSILKLASYITLDSTPVILVEELSKIDRETIIKQEQEINLLLDKWYKAVENGSYHDYLSFYSDEYLPEIDWWTKWSEIRKNLSGPSFKVERDKTGIYYHDKVFVVVFDNLLSINTDKILLGKRKLFLEKKGQTYKITGEEYQNVTKEFQSAQTPLIAAALRIAKPVLKPVSEIETKSAIGEKPAAEKKPAIEAKPAIEIKPVLETVSQWLAAWSAKDIDKYASFYANNFFSDGMNKKKWVERKRIIAGKNSFISVSGKKFQIKQQNDTCEVLFFQEYKSNGLTTQGTKKLNLINKGGLWKIYQESWKEK